MYDVCIVVIIIYTNISITILISISGLEQSSVQWFSLEVDLPPEGVFRGNRGGAVLLGSFAMCFQA